MSLPNTWHVLDASSVPVQEFASALGKIVPIVAWKPEMRTFPLLYRSRRSLVLSDPPLQMMTFPLQRGYSRAALAWLTSFSHQILTNLNSLSPSAPLICTNPFFAPVAEKYDGPVVYYATDYTVAYDGLNPDR